MTNAPSLLGFSTSNYDAMKKFLADFSFDVIENPNDQLTPYFERGRAARIRRDDLDFNLEESASGDKRAAFNLSLSGYTDKDIERLKSLGYTFERHVTPFWGVFHECETPDGGRLVLSEH